MQRFKTLNERLKEAEDQVVFWRSIALGTFIGWALALFAGIALIVNS